GDPAQIDIDTLAMVAPEIKTVETPPITKPCIKAIALTQETKCAPTARPSSPIAGNMKISSSGRLSAKSRLSRTFENRPPLSARGSRPFEPMADRTHNQVLDDGLDRSRDFFTAVPMTNLIDGFFHRAPRSKIRRDEAGIVQVIMTRNGS